MSGPESPSRVGRPTTESLPWPRDASALVARQETAGLVTPDYSGYCIANVPGTIAAVLDVATTNRLPRDVYADVDTDVSHVVLVVLDGLGYRRWRRDAAEHRFLARLDARGTVTPLTSVCPSSTGAAIPTLHTGATPAQHGVVGWDTYLPTHETIVETFPHTIRSDVSAGGDAPPCGPASVVRVDPVYPSFAAAGVDSVVVQPASTLGTAYADAVFDGATQCPYETVAAGATTVRQRLSAADGTGYTYLYVPTIDMTSHRHGTDSGAYHDALATVTRRLSRELYDRLDPAIAAETLLAVTADHGMIDIPPGAAGCLPVLADDAVRSSLRRWGGDSAGSPARLPPFGDPRLLHLAVQPGERSTVVDALRSRGAIALSRERARALELFGPEEGTPLDDRCGDVIATHPRRTLVHPAIDHVREKIGMHGGCTPQEMIVPFAAARLDRLQ